MPDITIKVPICVRGEMSKGICWNDKLTRVVGATFNLEDEIKKVDPAKDFLKIIQDIMLSYKDLPNIAS